MKFVLTELICCCDQSSCDRGLPMFGRPYKILFLSQHRCDSPSVLFHQTTNYKSRDLTLKKEYTVTCSTIFPRASRCRRLSYFPALSLFIFGHVTAGAQGALPGVAHVTLRWRSRGLPESTCNHYREWISTRLMFVSDLSTFGVRRELWGIIFSSCQNNETNCQLMF